MVNLDLSGEEGGIDLSRQTVSGPRSGWTKYLGLAWLMLKRKKTIYVENRATIAERVKRVNKREHSECTGDKTTSFILYWRYFERMIFALRALVRALHGDFQASEWVDISSVIANFSVFLLMFTFNYYLWKYQTCWMSVYVTNTSEI